MQRLPLINLCKWKGRNYNKVNTREWKESGSGRKGEETGGGKRTRKWWTVGLNSGQQCGPRPACTSLQHFRRVGPVRTKSSAKGGKVYQWDKIILLCLWPNRHGPVGPGGPNRFAFGKRCSFMSDWQQVSLQIAMDLISHLARVFNQVSLISIWVN